MESDAGLVFAFILDGRGSGKNVDWQGVETWDPSVGLLWTHFDYSDEIVSLFLIVIAFGLLILFKRIKWI